MTTFVLYHGRCLDGFGAAYAAWKALGEDDVEYIPVRYDEDPPEMEMDSIVYIVDFSYKYDVLLEMNERCHLTVLDHHKSAMDDLADLPDDIRVVFDLERSGAIITWDYFHEGPAPKLLQHIGDRDLWRFEMKNTEAICAALWHKDMDFEVWDQIINDTDQFKRLRYQGQMIIKVRDDNIRQANKCSFIAFIDGHRCVVANNPIHVSEAAHALLKKFPDVEFAVCFRMQSDGLWRWDFRARKDGFDVSEIAVKLGGGGHPSAAGARTEKLIFIRLEE